MKKIKNIFRLALLAMMGLMAVTCQKETNEMLPPGGEKGIETPMLKSVPENDFWWHHLHQVFYQIEDLVNTGTISDGIAKALLAKYNVAWDQLNRKGNYDSAIGSLVAFTNLVNALVLAKTITPEIGEELVFVPNAILDNFKHQCGDRLYDVRDGQAYTTVQIGDQCWLSENLKFKTESAHSYDDDPVNEEQYGFLYHQRDALIGCPVGWHLPGDEEWKKLERHLGMTESDADAEGFRYSGGVGFKLKSTTGWFNNHNGDNSSGFNALPGGYGSFLNDSYYGKLESASFWSSTSYHQTYAWFRQLSCGTDGVARNETKGGFGFSVRCVKNE
jgi:uncharacterized protein (TIGR02145 family)